MWRSSIRLLQRRLQLSLAYLALFVNYLAACFPAIAHHGGFITDLPQPASEQMLLTHPGLTHPGP